MNVIAESERKVAGENASPYALAQFLAIRDQFADKWQPSGIKSAMIDMLNRRLVDSDVGRQPSGIFIPIERTKCE